MAILKAREETQKENKSLQGWTGITETHRAGTQESRSSRAVPIHTCFMYCRVGGRKENGTGDSILLWPWKGRDWQIPGVAKSARPHVKRQARARSATYSKVDDF